MNFETSKNFSGIGSILLLVSFLTIPFISIFGPGTLGIVGLILMLMGIRGMADYYRDNRIFNYSLFGSITGVVGAVLTFAIAVLVFLPAATNFFRNVLPGWNGDWSSLSGLTPDASNIALSEAAPFVATFFALILIAFVFALATALLCRKSFLNLKEKTSVGLFGSASLLLLVGGALSIILIGYILMWVALLLAAIAFFQIKQPLQEAQAPPMATPGY